MNRKQRRAAGQANIAGERGARRQFGRAISSPTRSACSSSSKLDDAARAYKRLLLLKPDHAEAQQQSRPRPAGAGQARAKPRRSLPARSTLMPQLFDQFATICATLVAILPRFGDAMRRAMDGLAGAAERRATARRRRPAYRRRRSVAAQRLLQSIPVRDIALERAAHRAARRAARPRGGRQNAERRRARRSAARSRSSASSMNMSSRPRRTRMRSVARLGASSPRRPRRNRAARRSRPSRCISRCMRLPDAQALLDRAWPAAVDDVVTQQLREPLQEARADGLDPAADADRRRRLAARAAAVRGKPLSALGARHRRRAAESRSTAICAACFRPPPLRRSARPKRSRFWWPAAAPAGTPSGCAQRIAGRAAARRRSQPGKPRLCQAQDAGGARIAHRIRARRHPQARRASAAASMSSTPAACCITWPIRSTAGALLLTLLRPGGIMHLGFYSELGRRDVVAARAFIAERGYRPTPQDIRRCRQDLLGSPLAQRRPLQRFFQHQRMPRPAVPCAGKPHDHSGHQGVPRRAQS